METVYIIGKGRIEMYNWLIGMANTGDSSKPWLIAICLIVSIIVVVALFIIGQKDKGGKDDRDKRR